jgi:hypothetical protein
MGGIEDGAFAAPVGETVSAQAGGETVPRGTHSHAGSAGDVGHEAKPKPATGGRFTRGNRIRPLAPATRGKKRGPRACAYESLGVVGFWGGSTFG